MAGRRRVPQKIKMPSIADFKSCVNGIFNLRDRAFICFMYLTGARISEVVNRVKRFQVEFVEIKGNSFIVIHNVETLKRRGKLPHYRDILIPLSNKEDDFTKPVIEWLLRLPMNTLIFGFERRHGWTLVKKYTYLFPHYLRHLRLTHLVTEYGFTESELTKFTGWANSQPASTYVHLNLENLARKLGGN